MNIFFKTKKIVFTFSMRPLNIHEPPRPGIREPFRRLCRHGVFMCTTKKANRAKHVLVYMVLNLLPITHGSSRWSGSRRPLF